MSWIQTKDDPGDQLHVNALPMRGLVKVEKGFAWQMTLTPAEAVMLADFLLHSANAVRSAASLRAYRRDQSIGR